MKLTPEYQVRFGRDARTIIYEDQGGSLCFGFDFLPSRNPARGKWTVELGRQALTGDCTRTLPLTEECRPRIELAIERIKQYLLSCGYQIEDSSDQQD
jgi:hypothetical protein